MDEDLPRKAPNMVIGENIDSISVAELEQRIVDFGVRNRPASR